MKKKYRTKEDSMTELSSLINEKKSRRRSRVMNHRRPRPTDSKQFRTTSGILCRTTWLMLLYVLMDTPFLVNGFHYYGSSGRLASPCGLSFSDSSIMKKPTSSSSLSLSYASLGKAYSSIQSSTFISSTAILKSEILYEYDTSSSQNQQSTTVSSSSSSLSYFGITTYSSIRHRRSVIIMGKGDGKKKRKKKSVTDSTTASASIPSTSSPSSSKPTQPMRVSTDINIPIRRQIMYGRLNKQAANEAGTAYRKPKIERTSYRRTWDEEEIEQKAEERRRKGQDPDWDVILNRTAVSPLVIVDGYNIIHQWPRLKKHMLKGDTQRARQLLVDDLENLRTLKGWRIEVVFDGAGRNTVGPLGNGPAGSKTVTTADKALKKDVSRHGVRVVYTGVGIEADSYIEARCASAKNVTKGELTGSFIVATDDAMIRLAGQSAGAWCMSATRFVDELKATKKAIAYRVEAAVAKVNGHAIRPEKLRGTTLHSRFGRGSVLIEDKRNRTKAKLKKEEPKYEVELNIEVKEDENGIPWWAKMPEQQ